MTYEDFFSALTPYNFQKPKDNKKYFKQYKSQVEEIMHVADVDRDGFISFAEFYFFVVLCQTQEKMISKDFKNLGGKMTIAQFVKTVRDLKSKTNFSQKHNFKKN